MAYLLTSSSLFICTFSYVPMCWKVMYDWQAEQMVNEAYAADSNRGNSCFCFSLISCKASGSKFLLLCRSLTLSLVRAYPVQMHGIHYVCLDEILHILMQPDFQNPSSLDRKYIVYVYQPMYRTFGYLLIGHTNEALFSKISFLQSSNIWNIVQAFRVKPNYGIKSMNSMRPLLSLLTVGTQCLSLSLSPVKQHIISSSLCTSPLSFSFVSGYLDTVLTSMTCLSLGAVYALPSSPLLCFSAFSAVAVSQRSLRPMF